MPTPLSRVDGCPWLRERCHCPVPPTALYPAQSSEHGRRRRNGCPLLPHFCVKALALSHTEFRVWVDPWMLVRKKNRDRLPLFARQKHKDTLRILTPRGLWEGPCKQMFRWEHFAPKNDSPWQECDLSWCVVSKMFAGQLCERVHSSLTFPFPLKHTHTHTLHLGCEIGCVASSFLNKSSRRCRSLKNLLLQAQRPRALQLGLEPEPAEQGAEPGTFMGRVWLPCPQAVQLCPQVSAPVASPSIS